MANLLFILILINLLKYCLGGLSTLTTSNSENQAPINVTCIKLHFIKGFCEEINNNYLLNFIATKII